jgi:glyoxylase-like metal-dependent hydrolase (beta-lactamase superfamily II)
MAKVKVLVEGYAKEVDGVEFASSTATLVQDSGKNIVVDPGMDRKRLLRALEKEGLEPNGIDFVVMTHAHPDHILLVGIFENAEVLDSTEIHSFDGKIQGHKGKIPGTEVKIIRTPGHDQGQCSVLADTDDGIVIIASDLFWWAEGAEQKTDRESLMGLGDPYMKDKAALRKSRKKVLEMADYVIPGHGEMFRVGK